LRRKGIGVTSVCGVPLSLDMIDEPDKNRSSRITSEQ
jgi:hypothetical protein